MKKEKKESKIQVLDRATMILEAISRYTLPVNLKILSADTNLPTSTVFRILQSLIQNKFVENKGKGKYQLRVRIFRENYNRQSIVDFRKIALPYMEKLRDMFDETINLTVREGDVVIYIDKVTPNKMMHVQQMIGSRAPLHVTGVGKMMLGKDGAQGIVNYKSRTNLPTYTKRTISNLDELIDECLSCEKQGFAFDNEEAEIGVGCIGVLIRDFYGEAIAGLSVSAPIEKRKIEWIEHLTQAGKDISQELGYVFNNHN